MNYIEEIKELRKLKLNNSEIAEHLGISIEQVKNLSSANPYEEDSLDNDNVEYYEYSNDDSDAIRVALDS
jgi:orotate phosphoribosyltransferase-like protein